MNDHILKWINQAKPTLRNAHVLESDGVLEGHVAFFGKKSSDVDILKHNEWHF